MKRLKQAVTVIFYSFFFTASLLLPITQLNAQTLEDLQQADKLRINVWVEPEQNIIARQQINLQIEVATDKWFAGGTQIGHFEIKDAIVLQREKFAVNSTRSEGDKSWTVQQWMLVIYPQRGGLIEVPAIPLKLSIAGEGAESITGEVFTRSFDFEVTIPEQVAGNKNWIATSRFEVEDSFNKSLDELGAGDALMRTIKISADNLPAMMLPAIVPDEIPGIAVYVKSPQLTDKVNRGDYLAERLQSITYVFEEEGEYHLPKQSFYCWNLETEAYEVIELEEHILMVSGSVSAAGEGEKISRGVDKSSLLDSLPLLKKVIALVIIFVAVGYVVRKLNKNDKKKNDTNSVRITESELKKQFDKACADRELEKAVAIFYKWLDNYAEVGFSGSIRESLNTLDQKALSQSFYDVMQSVYAENRNKDADLKQFSRQLAGELKKQETKTLLSHLTVDLKLN